MIMTSGKFVCGSPFHLATAQSLRVNKEGWWFEHSVS